MPETIERLADALVRNPVPVVAMDTCSILDVVRAPASGESSNLVDGCVRLLEAAPELVCLVMAEPALREWTDNAGTVAQSITDVLKGLDRQTQDLHRLATNMSWVSTEQPPVRYEWLVPRLQATAAELVARSQLLQQDDGCTLAASRRLHEGRPPAGRGRREYVDCEIFEHYIAFARALRDRGFLPPIIFVSSNTRDYGRPGMIDKALADELALAGMTFVTSLAWAASVALSPQPRAR